MHGHPPYPLRTVPRRTPWANLLCVLCACQVAACAEAALATPGVTARCGGEADARVEAATAFHGEGNPNPNPKPDPDPNPNPSPNPDQEHAAALQAQSDSVRASAQVQAQALRAEVASWREEAGLADQKARQQDELANVVGAQAELHALELKDEI